MFKSKKAAKEAAAKKAALRADLKNLMQIANEPITVQTAIEKRKKLYLAVQQIRSKYGLTVLPEIISIPGWTKNLENIPYSFRDDDGEWMNPREDWMRKWENTPTEIGPMVTEKVTPMGAWMYQHEGWCKDLCKEIETYLAA